MARILVIDDDPDIRFVARIALRCGKHEVTVAESGRDALMHLQESIVNNVSAHIFEHALTQKYPEHRKLFKTLSWLERISFSARAWFSGPGASMAITTTAPAFCWATATGISNRLRSLRFTWGIAAGTSPSSITITMARSIWFR